MFLGNCLCPIHWSQVLRCEWLVAWLPVSHYLKQCWNIVNWILGNKSQWNFFNGNLYIFIKENIFEIVRILVGILSQPQCIDSLWSSDAIWQHRSGSTLAQVMACCLTAPSHYLNQSWLIISTVQWDSSGDNFTWDTSAIELENDSYKIPFKSPMVQWVNHRQLCSPIHHLSDIS